MSFKCGHDKFRLKKKVSKGLEELNHTMKIVDLLDTFTTSYY